MPNHDWPSHTPWPPGNGDPGSALTNDPAADERAHRWAAVGAIGTALEVMLTGVGFTFTETWDVPHGKVLWVVEEGANGERRPE